MPQSWEREKERLRGRLAQMNKINAPTVKTRSLERELAYHPISVEAALILWSQARDAFEERGLPPAPYAEPFPAQDPQEQRNMRTNFLALVLF